jgi:hypothetical protein
MLRDFRQCAETDSHPKGKLDTPAPVGITALIRRPKIAALLVAGVLAALANGVLDPGLALHMIDNFQYAEKTVGYAFGVNGAAYIMSSPFIG